MYTTKEDLDSVSKLDGSNLQSTAIIQPRIELFISCRNLELVNGQAMNPKVRVYSVENGKERLQDETELVYNNIDPDFFKSFVLMYTFEERQLLRFEVINLEGPGKYELLGDVQLFLGEIIGCKQKAVVVDIINEDKKNGTLIVRGEQVYGLQTTGFFEVFATKLTAKGSWFSNSSPYFKLARKTNSSENAILYQSEVVKQSSSPIWKPFRISLQTLSNGDRLTPMNLGVYTSKTFKEKLIGQCSFNVGEVLDSKEVSFELKNDENVNTGTIFIRRSSPNTVPTFLDYLRGGVQLNTMIAIDFTASNGEIHKLGSLHAIKTNEEPNDYQRNIQGVCSTLLNYDYDKKVPVYGFGGIPSGLESDPTSHCFALNGDENNPTVDGLYGIIDVYKRVLQTVKMDGPTYFENILEKAIDLAKKSVSKGSKEYLVLLILTDGQIHDMQQTINCLIKAAQLPLSVIIIGIGSDEFKGMDVFCGKKSLENKEGYKIERDLVQFVSFDEYKRNHEQLAKDVLQKIPAQLLGYMNEMEIEPDTQDEAALSEMLLSKQAKQQDI